MARRSGAKPEGARVPEPLFNVFVDYETFAGRICELANGADTDERSPGFSTGPGLRKSSSKDASYARRVPDNARDPALPSASPATSHALCGRFSVPEPSKRPISRRGGHGVT